MIGEELFNLYSWQDACAYILKLCHEKNLLFLFSFIISCNYIMS
jgi:hypothetical protein